MKFFRGREATHVKAIRGVRAMYLSPDHQEVNIEFLHEDGNRLTLQLTPEQTRGLIGDLVAAYEAINPPLNTRSNNYSTWLGME